MKRRKMMTEKEFTQIKSMLNVGISIPKIVAVSGKSSATVAKIKGYETLVTLRKAMREERESYKRKEVVILPKFPPVDTKSQPLDWQTKPIIKGTLVEAINQIADELNQIKKVMIECHTTFKIFQENHRRLKLC